MGLTQGCAYKTLQLVFLKVNDKASDYTCNTEFNNRLITYMNKPLGVFKKGPGGVKKCVTTHDIKIELYDNLISTR